MGKYSLFTHSLIAIVSFGASAQAQTYNPTQVMAVFRQAIQDVVHPNPPGNSWFSLTMVGAVAEPEDPTIVNDLANFCPEPGPLITSFRRVRQLDRIYQAILEGTIGPVRSPTPEYTEARQFLFRDGDLSPEYKAYNAAGQNYADALTAYHSETDLKKRTSLLQKVVAADQQWMLSGYRGEVDAAFLQIAAGETKFGPVKIGQRSRVLQWYKAKGLSPTDTAGAYKSPASELSPPVASWETKTAGSLSATPILKLQSDIMKALQAAQASLA